MADTPDWRRMFDLKHPMLKPLWVRLVLIAVCFAWAVVELTMGSLYWAIAVAIIGLYMAWVFFVSADRTYFSSNDKEEP
ncbi:DUF3329 domain-containing protein [Martelella endophytica]|uniref:DUF3329 domain-containing protein n=1 Tax=Martelella endophytica TaxID=1486262 RepID=UPI000A7A27E9|nr:DUF3329 domain-containing protein [Martelella endophytica]